MRKLLAVLLFLSSQAFASDFDYEQLLNDAIRISGLPRPVGASPIIKAAARHELIERLFNVTNPGPKMLALEVGGLYIPSTRTLYVWNGADPDDALGRSIVVHEMTHWLQHAANQWRPLPHDCGLKQRLEAQAYGVQNEYLREQRDPRQLVITTFC